LIPAAVSEQRSLLEKKTERRECGQANTSRRQNGMVLWGGLPVCRFAPQEFHQAYRGELTKWHEKLYNLLCQYSEVLCLLFPNIPKLLKK
jgi:hypothetical protein